MKSIRKALDALKLLRDPPHEVAVGDVARALGTTVSTASRILAALRDGDLVEQDPVTRRYRPGQLAAHLAGGFNRSTDTMVCVQEAMNDLVAKTRHTAWAGVLSGADVIVLRIVHGGFPVRFEVELGHALPAHAAALGKALLALLPDAEVTRLCGPRLAALTPRTHRSSRRLLEDLAATRERGYAVSDQELFPGVRSIAVAFQTTAEPRPMSMGLSYPIFSIDPAHEQGLIDALIACARHLGQRLGDRRWSGAAGSARKLSLQIHGQRASSPARPRTSRRS